MTFTLIVVTPTKRPHIEMGILRKILPSNHVMQRTRHYVAVCNHCVPRAGSLSLSRRSLRAMKRFRAYCFALMAFVALGSGCATTQHNASYRGDLLEREVVKTPTEEFTAYLTWFVLEFAYGLGQSGCAFEIK